MAPITIQYQIDPQDYLQEGKKKITEGFKCLHDLVQWCKHSSSLENSGILDETTTYLQSLPRRIQEIECVAQQEGAAPPSFNVHGTDLQHGQTTVIESVAPQGDAFVSNPHVNEQEITQTSEQNINFGSTLNQKTNKKRKTWSDVWNHFKKYENKNKEIRAQCQYCKKDFNGSSKSGTTHLRNHVKSCLKNQNKVADKMKELSVDDQELHDSDLVRKVIKYGWNNIKIDMIKVYKEEKNKLHRYLDKLSGRFNVTIENDPGSFDIEFVKIWFIDDEWKLKTRIIPLENYDSYGSLLNEHSLKLLIEDWNIDKKILSMFDYRQDPSEDTVRQLTNWLNERVSLPVIGNYRTHADLFHLFYHRVKQVAEGSDIISEVEKLKDYCKTLSNKDKFDLAVKQVESMGKKVTSKYNDVDPDYLHRFDLVDWAMGYKEVFCELKRRDPDFPSSNFDWDDATSLHSLCAVVGDIRNDSGELLELANECFPMVQFFSKMLQFKNTENQYFRLAALRCREFFDEHCNNIVTVIPVILDPRFKLGIVEHFYNEVYDNEADLHFKKIMDDVTNIYNKYATDVNNSSMVRANANKASSSQSEFDRYLTADKVPPHEGFDILEWWRVNSPTYPALAMMARDFLSIPIVNSPDIYFVADLDFDVWSTDLDVDLNDVLAFTKVWLNDHNCM